MEYSTGEARLAPTVALLARIRNATLFFALKVQYNLAQGNALGVIMSLLYTPCKGNTLKPNVLHDGANVSHWANATHRRRSAGFIGNVTI